jgi:hypothetical protein
MSGHGNQGADYLNGRHKEAAPTPPAAGEAPAVVQASKTPLYDLAMREFESMRYPILLWQGLVKQVEEENADLRSRLAPHGQAVAAPAQEASPQEFQRLTGEQQMALHGTRPDVLARLAHVLLGHVHHGKSNRDESAKKLVACINELEFHAQSAALAVPPAPAGEASPKRGTDAQILFERKLTCEAIQGAMAFGYQNTNPPPEPDHWLAPFWQIGRKQAELEAGRVQTEGPSHG